jgi:hypothetical protein
MNTTLTEDGVLIENAEPVEQFSHQLLERADPRFLRVDGDVITCIGTNVTHRYRITERDELWVTAELIESVAATA